MSSAAEFSIRRATADDAALIARHRVGMFSDMGQVPTEALQASLGCGNPTALLREGS